MARLINQEKLNKSGSCVAWFRLAELVSRGEREKALTLYRLLSYSFKNKAYALQVEGDLLWSMEDKRAINKYSQAAYLYEEDKDIVAAIGVFEHLLTLQPKSFKYSSSLLRLNKLRPRA